MSSPLVWLALDGVGHPLDAPPDSAWDTHLPTLRPLIDAGYALDTTLGVEGLPQSGTGQACWLTGLDAVRYMGEHFGPQPGPTLRRLLDSHSLPMRLKAAGGHVGLANFYPPAYLAAQARRPRHGCFPYSALSAGLSLNPSDLPAIPPTLGLSYAAPWLPHGPDTAELSRLGAQLARAALAANYDLVMLDLWLSDSIGHSGAEPIPPESLVAGREYLRRVDALLSGILSAGGAAVISSDHGNLEDLRVGRHTWARVPLAWAGFAGQTATAPANIAEGGRWLQEQFRLSALSIPLPLTDT